jgi:hypothetical protein
MINRATQFAIAIFASVLAGTAVATVSHSAAAADNCLSAPTGQSPEGSHWYYRINRATKNHCWYLGELRESTGRAVTAKSSAPGQRSSADADSSIAEAHTDLSRQAAKPHGGELPTSAKDSLAPVRAKSISASRWLDQANAAKTRYSDYRAGNLTVGSVARTEQPMRVSEQPAATDNLSDSYPGAFSEAKPSSYSEPMRLTALMGALLLAATIASGFFKFVSAGQPALAKIRKRRRMNWESANCRDRNARAYSAPAAGAARQPRQLHRVGDPNDRMAEFIAQRRRRPA